MFWAMGKLLKELVARDGIEPPTPTSSGRLPNCGSGLNSMDVAEVQGLTTYILVSSFGVPYGSRTRVAAVKGRCPRPLDERDALRIQVNYCTRSRSVKYRKNRCWVFCNQPMIPW